MGRKIKILHIINSLEVGGAEMMLYKLVKNSDGSKYSHKVITLVKAGPLVSKITAAGISVISLEMSRKITKVDNLKSYKNLVQTIRREDPDIIQTWMYHSDLFGGIAAKLSSNARIVWGVRNGTLDERKSKIGTKYVRKLCALLSKTVPDKIVCCSLDASKIHKEIGYSQRKLHVIPNGFDLNIFKPEENHRRDLREEFGIIGNEKLIGMIARLDPQKDIKTFIIAASIVKQHHANVKFLLCGKDMSIENREITQLIDDYSLRDRFILLGYRSDIPKILNAIDILALSSAYGEAFPNVLGEAMATCVPCVSTDVGDSAFIIGDHGRVVPPRNPRALANALDELLSLTTLRLKEIGVAARHRIKEKFDLNITIKDYENLYMELMSYNQFSDNSTPKNCRYNRTHD